MALKVECPRCGAVSTNIVRGVCRACYARDFHQRRAALAVTECPRCGAFSANFVRGVCRACYMRDFHQRCSASEGQRLCVECQKAGIYARGLCRPCYMRDYRQRRSASGKQSASDQQRVIEPATFTNDSEGRRLCAECQKAGIYARGLCHNCYLRDNRRRRRMKLRTCAICGVSFQSARRDALYCSVTCRQRAQRVRNASPITATMISSTAYATAGVAAKVRAMVMRGLFRPRRLLSIYQPVAASRVVLGTESLFSK